MALVGAGIWGMAVNLGPAVIALMLRSYALAGKAMAPEPADLVPLRAG